MKYYTPEEVAAHEARYSTINSDIVQSKFINKRIKYLQLAKEGLTSEEIGIKLKVPKRTVDGIFEKLRFAVGADRMITLVLEAIRLKIIEL